MKKKINLKTNVKLKKSIYKLLEGRRKKSKVSKNFFNFEIYFVSLRLNMFNVLILFLYIL